MAKTFFDFLESVLRMKRLPLYEPLFRSFMATKRGRTKELYECTLRKLQGYEPALADMPVENITHEWLCGFESFLARTAPSRNARNIHLRNVRTVYYIALDDGIVSRNPFRRFKIRAEATPKRALTAAQLRKFATVEVAPWLEKYRDAFLLMFMLRGINVVDFCNLHSIEGHYIRYRRSKTGRLFEVRVEPEALVLIRRLRGKNHLLYPLDRVKDYRTYTGKINKALQRIAASIPGFPPITTYWARHTWATLAASIDIPKETIAAALGHTSSTVTDIYIDFDTRKIHNANRKVIRHVFR